ncbi:oligosaccharide flippase family protein [Erwinia sp. CPCC 100877]|nr:oligosaccharide flippase family protein [Erwinia sp. CPCC 100877]
MVINIFYLMLIQISNYIFPLISLPYLVRVLGPSQFGYLMLSQALIQYFIILTDYGFNLSATKKIAIAKNQREIDCIYTSTLSAKFILLIVSLLSLTFVVTIFDSFKSIQLISLIMFLAVIGNVLFPIYLFQGLEKMKDITWITLLSKMLMLISMFIFVRKKSDIELAALSLALPMLIPGIIASIYVKKKKIANLRDISFSRGMGELKNSSTLFFSQVAISFYTTFNTILLGNYFPPSTVGFYSAADRLRSAVQSCLSPIQQVVYPRINKDINNLRFNIKKYGGGFILISLFISVIIFLGGERLALLYLGDEFLTSAVLFKWMSVIVFIVCLAIVFGQWGLISLGKEKLLTKIYFFGAVVHCVYSIPLLKIYGVYGMLSSVILTETVITVMMMFFYFSIIKRKNND